MLVSVILRRNSQLVIPAALRFGILSNVHDQVSGAHFGVNKSF